MKTLKYAYYKVIQSNYGFGWENEDFYSCNSRGIMTREERASMRENLKAYRENGRGQYRIRRKRELNTNTQFVG